MRLPSSGTGRCILGGELQATDLRLDAIERLFALTLGMQDVANLPPFPQHGPTDVEALRSPPQAGFRLERRGQQRKEHAIQRKQRH
jgi:hypothetical protein